MIRRRLLALLAVVYLAVGFATGLLGGWAWQSAIPGCRLRELARPHLEDYVLAVAGGLLRHDGDWARCALADLPEAELADLIDGAAASVAARAATDPAHVQAMVALAAAFGRDRADLLAYAATPRLAADAVATAVGSSAGTATLGVSRFELVASDVVCQPGRGAPRVTVLVTGAAGEPLAGARVRLASDAATVELSSSDAGVAEFTLAGEQDYTLAIVGGGEELGEVVTLHPGELGCGIERHLAWRVHWAMDTR